MLCRLGVLREGLGAMGMGAVLATVIGVDMVAWAFC